MIVNAPNTQCPTVVGRALVSVTIPRNSTIRQVEGYWNGTRLPLVAVYNTPQDTLVDDYNVNYGGTDVERIPFNTPLWSLAGVATGAGTLEVRGYDATNHLVSKVTIPNLYNSPAPTPVDSSALSARSHPRFLLTPTRLARAKAKILANDSQARSFLDALAFFLGAYDNVSNDPTSPAFINEVYAPQSYAFVLGLCYQVYKDTDPTKAAKCADAGVKLAVGWLSVNNCGGSCNELAMFRFDTGYRIKDTYQYLAITYDWLYDALSSGQRSTIRGILNDWCEWYGTGKIGGVQQGSDTGGYSRARPTNNYYPPFIWALAANGIITAGENGSAGTWLTQLRTKLYEEQGTANQRMCGGVWLEGTNYDVDSMISDLQVDVAMRDVGEDWHDAFEFLQPRALVYEYAVTSDGSLHLPWGGVSGNRPDTLSPAFLAMAQTETAFGGNATHLYNQLEPLPNDFDTNRGTTAWDVMFGDLVQSNSAPSPLSCLATGAGRAYSMSSLTRPSASGYLVAMESQHAGYDHYGYASGDVRFYKGATCLLCSSTYRGNFNGQEGTAAFSTFIVNGAVQYEYNRSRNNRWLFALEHPAWAAWGVEMSSAYALNPYDQAYFDGADQPLVDYLIREVVHVRPDVLVVRDLHKRNNGSATLLALWHLGPTSGGASAGGGVYTIGSITIATYNSNAPSVAWSNDVDQGSATVGRRMTMTYPLGTGEMESINVFSDTGVTISSYAGGVLHLSNSKCITFANGTVSVASC
jgi:hypothetical protein